MLGKDFLCAPNEPTKVMRAASNLVTHSRLDEDKPATKLQLRRLFSKVTFFNNGTQRSHSALPGKQLGGDSESASVTTVKALTTLTWDNCDGLFSSLVPDRDAA